MTNDDWKTLRVPVADYNDAKAQKEEHGRTWGEQIVRPDGDGGEDYPDADEIAAAVTASLDLDTDHDFDTLAHEVAARIDYAMLASKVADELETRIA